jgi:hypothetical protein
MTAAEPVGGGPHARSASGGEDVQEIADAALACERVGEASPGGDGVVVASALALALEVAGVDQLSDDPVRGAFGDADLIADLPQPDSWVVRDAKQHLPVIAEKRSS